MGVRDRSGSYDAYGGSPEVGPGVAMRAAALGGTPELNQVGRLFAVVVKVDGAEAVGASVAIYDVADSGASRGWLPSVTMPLWRTESPVWRGITGEGGRCLLDISPRPERLVVCARMGGKAGVVWFGRGEDEVQVDLLDSNSIRVVVSHENGLPVVGMAVGIAVRRKNTEGSVDAYIRCGVTGSDGVCEVVGLLCALRQLGFSPSDCSGQIEGDSALGAKSDMFSFKELGGTVSIVVPLSGCVKVELVDEWTGLPVGGGVVAVAELVGQSVEAARIAVARFDSGGIARLDRIPLGSRWRASVMDLPFIFAEFDGPKAFEDTVSVQLRVPHSPRLVARLLASGGSLVGAALSATVDNEVFQEVRVDSQGRIVVILPPEYVGRNIRKLTVASDGLAGQWMGDKRLAVGMNYLADVEVQVRDGYERGSRVQVAIACEGVAGLELEAVHALLRDDWGRVIEPLHRSEFDGVMTFTWESVARGDYHVVYGLAGAPSAMGSSRLVVDDLDIKRKLDAGLRGRVEGLRLVAFEWDEDVAVNWRLSDSWDGGRSRAWSPGRFVAHVAEGASVKVYAQGFRQLEVVPRAEVNRVSFPGALQVSLKLAGELPEDVARVFLVMRGDVWCESLGQAREAVSSNGSWSVRLPGAGHYDVVAEVAGGGLYMGDVSVVDGEDALVVRMEHRR